MPAPRRLLRSNGVPSPALLAARGGSSRTPRAIPDPVIIFLEQR